jgi:PleD family two-component response regulator
LERRLFTQKRACVPFPAHVIRKKGDTHGKLLTNGAFFRPPLDGLNLVSEQGREIETMMTTTQMTTPLTGKTASQQVVVVSKQSQLNGLLETVLDAGQYDVVFVESTEHAYSHIKRLTPHLIIVCLDIDDLDGFQVLSMLKLDSETRSIPVVTCTVSSEEDASGGEMFERGDGDVFSEPPAMCMN